MTNQIILNDRSETKDQDMEDFLSQDNLFVNRDLEKRALNTDTDYEKLFADLIVEFKPDSFTEFQEKIASAFDNKLDEPLERWANKLLLDRATLAMLFNHDG